MDCGVVWYTKSMYYQWLGQLPFTLPTYSILTLQTSDKHVRLSMHRLVLAQMICKGKGVWYSSGKSVPATMAMRWPLA